MFIRKKKSSLTSKVAIQIVESERVGRRVRQKIIQHVGSSEHPEDLKRLVSVAEEIMIRLKQERIPPSPLFGPEKFIQYRNKNNEDFADVGLKQLREKHRFNRGIADVFGKLYDDLNFDSVFKGRHAELNNRILKSCVLGRLANPSSKLRTAKLLEKKFSVRLHVDKIYRMMDQLDSKKVKYLVRRATLGILREQVSILFFDVTTLYFESFTEDDLRSFGFSKDCKFKETQVVLALITTTDGLPITYEVFPGNTHEIKTLLPVLRELKKEFDIKSVELSFAELITPFTIPQNKFCGSLTSFEFAADRGMFGNENMEALEKEGLSYVVGAKLKGMSRATKQEILSIHKQQTEGEDGYLEKDIRYRGRRVVICYNPIMAVKDRKDRKRLLGRLDKITDSKGEVAAKALVRNSGTKKYLRFDKEKKMATVDINKVSFAAAWDGISGYITNSEAPAADVIANYRRLWEIEESFRITKHDLKIRPIYHYKSQRIKAHLDICFIVYTLARQLMYRYKIQQSKAKSFRALHEALSETEFSLLVHIQTKEQYALPSSLSPLAKNLYRIVGLKPSTTPYKI